MKVIDADAHVEECEATWDYLDPAFRAYRPVPITLDSVDTYYGRRNAFWLIEGKTFPKMAGPGWNIMTTPTSSVAAQAKPASVGAQTMTDVAARLADMDLQGVDTQVVLPTIFLAPVADDPKLERALCQSYNRFMSKACAESNGRVHFVAAIPLRSVDYAIEVARDAKQLGAVGAMVHGMWLDTSLSEEVCWPFYTELCKLDIPMCIHFAWGSPTISSVFRDFVNAAFSPVALPALMGFYSLLAGGIFERYPDLKVAFLELGCAWVPYVVQQLDRRYRHGTMPAASRLPSETLRRSHVYVAAEADEDIAYVSNYIGEHQLVLASDYPHDDFSSEDNMVSAIARNSGVSAELQRMLLSTNPQRLFGLPA